MGIPGYNNSNADDFRTHVGIFLGETALFSSLQRLEPSRSAAIFYLTVKAGGLNSLHSRYSVNRSRCCFFVLNKREFRVVRKLSS